MEEDKAIKWLEENVNKKDLFYFKQNEKFKSIIDCYRKEDNTYCCVFYREAIEKGKENHKNWAKAK